MNLQNQDLECLDALSSMIEEEIIEDADFEQMFLEELDIIAVKKSAFCMRIGGEL